MGSGKSVRADASATAQMPAADDQRMAVREPVSGQAGKTTVHDWALLIWFQPSTTELTQACFLWINDQLEPLSGTTTEARQRLITSDYREYGGDARLVSIPFTVFLRTSVLSRMKEFEEGFSVAGAVHVTLWTK